MGGFGVIIHNEKRKTFPRVKTREQWLHAKAIIPPKTRSIVKNEIHVSGKIKLHYKETLSRGVYIVFFL